jgi:hypothetical protein
MKISITLPEGKEDLKAESLDEFGEYPVPEPPNPSAEQSQFNKLIVEAPGE